MDNDHQEEDMIFNVNENESQAPMTAKPADLRAAVEAIIFASPKPMKAVDIYDLLRSDDFTLERVQEELDALQNYYDERAGGFVLRYVKKMGYQFQTSDSVRNIMEKQFASRPRPLSRAALETLAVIAYRQKKSKGVTRAEVEFIRGVDAGSMFKTLMERGLIRCVGRKEIPGRPLMFAVTDEFLKTFQLASTEDLPPLESFQVPSETLKSAQEKIAAFEEELEASVDPDKFLADENYRNETTPIGDITSPDSNLDTVVSKHV